MNTDITSHFNKTQSEGISKFHLTKEQVQDPNFGEHTLIGIRTLLSKNRFRLLSRRNLTADYKAAYNKIAGLNVYQTHGVTKFKLMAMQVVNPNFGPHTIIGMKNLVRENRAVDYQHAYIKLARLNNIQTQGVDLFQLSRDQVEDPNFGPHTINGMNLLQQQNHTLSNQDAYNRLAGLNIDRTSNRIFQLDTEQIGSPNFGQHTLGGIVELLKQERAANINEAFDMLVGLNHIETIGLVNYELSREQVEDSNFGKHTLDCMTKLIKQKRAPNNKKAFEMIADLNFIQKNGVVNLKLSREQVENPKYNNFIYPAMSALKNFNPKVKESHLYKTVMNIEYMQTRAIVAKQFTLEQIGLKIVRNRFEPIETNLSENAINVMKILVAKNPEFSQEEMYNIAVKLNTYQSIGLIDLGLSLKQVINEQFKVSGKNILDELMDGLEDKPEFEKGFDLPLTKKQQVVAREKLDEINKPSQTDDTTLVTSYLSELTRPSNKEKKSKTTSNKGKIFFKKKPNTRNSPNNGV